MKTRLFALLVVLTLALSSGAITLDAVPLDPGPRHTALVTNSNNVGPGSFRHAIDLANIDPAIGRVQFLPRVSTVFLTGTVFFSGVQDLAIDGAGATLDGTAAGGDVFVASGGGDLVVTNLTVRNATGEGLEVQVPTWAAGTIHVSLVNVDIVENDGHGVLVNDQEDPLDVANQNGSDASVDVTVIGSHFLRNGYSVSDRDGLRVNEGGLGDLTLTFTLSAADGNGADGIEVDERATGDVLLNMFGSRMHENGIFDPLDFDDGFDIDEAGDGSIVGKVVFSSANDNYEQGFDFNENDAGDLRVDMVLVEASRNAQEGIEYEEDDDFAGGGDIVATMTGIKANGNKSGDAGLKTREKGAGNVDVTINVVETSNNLVGGILVREDAQGSLVSSITRATSMANAGHGIDFDENRLNTSDPGDLTAGVSDSNSSNNTLAGVRADQAAPGVGSLLLTAVTLNGNTGGATTGGGVTVTIVP